MKCRLSQLTDRNRERAKKYYWDNRERILKNNAKKKKWRRYRNTRRIYARQMRETAISLGRCPSCQKRDLDNPKFKRCSDCRKYQREYYQKNKKVKR